ncbi:MAG TPA: magnesium transporter [Tepidisphaeraceae bacterium]|jgi:magnesium transporter
MNDEVTKLPFAHAADEERAKLAAQIEELPPSEAAGVMGLLPPDQAAAVAEYLDPETVARLMAKMDATTAAVIVSAMHAPEASLVLEHMNPDDRVDILEYVHGPLHEQLVGEMNEEHRDEVRQLEQYAPDSAGGIMTTQVTALYEHISVDDAITLLRRLNEELEQMFYVYVIDRRQHLVGVLSMRDLILARPERKLRDIMIPNVRSVPATMDQEKVAEIMRDQGYLAMPVVDAENKLIGLITLDDVVKVVQEEATEDVQKMFGAGAEERLSSPWHFSFKKRVVWLEVNLATAFMAAAVVSFFTETIAALPILAAYQTIVSGMGGNAGAQAMAVAIRGIAVGEAKGPILRRVLKREFMVGLCSGLVIGATTGVIATVFNYSNHGLLIGMVVCIALILNHINACVTGVLVPFAMKKLGFDPAQSATIFATTFTDCGGFFACLGLAKIALLWIGKMP